MTKDICKFIRWYKPSVYGDKLDDYIRNYCSFYSKVYELVVNKGVSVNDYDLLKQQL
jgi:hypothetical protein